MAKLLLTNTFLDELASLDDAVVEETWAKLETVEAFPGVGSALLEPYLRSTYGPSCLKVAVYRYDLIYRRNDADNEVHILGIVPQRVVR